MIRWRGRMALQICPSARMLTASASLRGLCLAPQAQPVKQLGDLGGGSGRGMGRIDDHSQRGYQLAWVGGWQCLANVKINYGHPVHRGKNWKQSYVNRSGLENPPALDYLAAGWFFQLLPKLHPTDSHRNHSQAFVRDRALLWQHNLYTLQTALLGLSLGVLIACCPDPHHGSAMPGSMRCSIPILVVIQTIPVPLLPFWSSGWLLLWHSSKIVPHCPHHHLPIICQYPGWFRQCDADKAPGFFELVGAKPCRSSGIWKSQTPCLISMRACGSSVSMPLSAPSFPNGWNGFEGLGVYMIQSKKTFPVRYVCHPIILVCWVSLWLWSWSKSMTRHGHQMRP